MASYVTTKHSPLFPILMIVILLITLFPIYWIVVTSLKTPVENILPVPTLYPHKFTLDNYQKVLLGGSLRNLFNSIFVTAVSTLLSLAIGFLAAYALVRYKFPLKFNVVFLVWIIIVKMLPPVVLAVPLYEMFSKMHLINNLWGLVVVFQVYTLPYCIWMLFGFLKTLPLEYEEAADIDGASRLQIVRLVVFPLVQTGVVATAIFSIIVAWDEFLFSMLFIRSPELQTLPLAIVGYIGEFETLWGQLMAISVLAIIPIIIFVRFVYREMASAYSLGLK
ncbi:Binding-protein-dependent transport systems inner membrane component [uncultured spirochete]|uniref:Binding-protein-dependent transport systems inner membrane component n=1 Tax=uncultured spirochete TaxID=156406 RepID=A0A3P3XSD6_9SPIR|nr:Binding-protein-dependent transport systems inner membrane component [uncultured spirochete]